MGRTAQTIVGTVVATVLVAILILPILLYTGAYNVSAAAGHTAVGRWVLGTMMHNSVEARADTQPPRFTEAMVRSGAGEYKSMCEHCHAGPGVSRAEWADGMTPLPPELTHEAREWSPGEIHWIVKHGIKMTGMPAFGPTHDDQTVWNITAFVKQLPEMSPQTYAAFPAGHGHGGGSHGGGRSDSGNQSDSEASGTSGGQPHSDGHSH